MQAELKGTHHELLTKAGWKHMGGKHHNYIHSEYPGHIIYLKGRTWGHSNFGDTGTPPHEVNEGSDSMDLNKHLEKFHSSQHSEPDNDFDRVIHGHGFKKHSSFRYEHPKLGTVLFHEPNSGEWHVVSRHSGLGGQDGKGHRDLDEHLKKIHSSQYSEPDKDIDLYEDITQPAIQKRHARIRKLISERGHYIVHTPHGKMVFPYNHSEGMSHEQFKKRSTQYSEPEDDWEEGDDDDGSDVEQHAESAANELLAVAKSYGYEPDQKKKQLVNGKHNIRLVGNRGAYTHSSGVTGVGPKELQQHLAATHGSQHSEQPPEYPTAPTNTTMVNSDYPSIGPAVTVLPGKPVQFAETKGHPHLDSIVKTMSLDNGANFKHAAMPTAHKAHLESQAAKLNDEEKETVAAGEHEDMKKVVKKHGVHQLHHYLGHVFDGVGPYKPISHEEAVTHFKKNQ